MRRPPWVDRDGVVATCSRCGATSKYRVLHGFRSSCSGRPKRYDYWYWWKHFKQHHKRCMPRNEP